MEYPVYKQEDYPQELGSGQGYSIARYGCALCCVTSVCNWYGRSITPVEMNLQLSQHGGFAPNGTISSDGSPNKTLLVWGMIASIYGEIKLEQNIAYPTSPANMQMVDAYLLHNMPVIVGVSFTHDPKAQFPTHYVTLYKKNGDGTYQAYDPWYGDHVVYDTRYAVGGMNVAQSILQVVAYAGPAPTEQPTNAPAASHQQAAVTPDTHLQEEAQNNWNLYLQEVELVKQKSDRIQELEVQLSQLSDANGKLTSEIAQTKELNSTLATRISQIETQDSAAIEEGIKAKEQLAKEQEITHTAASILKTKPTLKGIMSELDALFQKVTLAGKLAPGPKVAPPVSQPVPPKAKAQNVFDLLRGGE